MGDQRMIDAKEVDQEFHSNMPILQGCEQVEMAFKGKRDMTLFTTKRLIIVDVSSWSQNKKNFLCFPWKNIQAFGVRSAGSFLDFDAEMFFWTEIHFDPPPPKQNENDHPQPLPGKSFIGIDFAKDKIDLPLINRYLASRIAFVSAWSTAPSSMPVPAGVLADKESGKTVESFLNWLG